MSKNAALAWATDELSKNGHFLIIIMGSVRTTITDWRDSQPLALLDYWVLYTPIRVPEGPEGREGSEGRKGWREILNLSRFSRVRWRSPVVLLQVKCVRCDHEANWLVRPEHLSFSKTRQAVTCNECGLWITDESVKRQHFIPRLPANSISQI